MKKSFFTIIFFLAISTASFAQNFFGSSDLSSVQVDQLTNTEISKIQAQLQASKMTLEMAEPLALSKGMNAGEFAKLRVRLQNLSTSSSVITPEVEATVQKEEVRKSNAMKDLGGANAIFGSELFDNPSLTFEPNSKAATPMNYVLGAGDELQISVYGVQEFNATAPISAEGKISLQFVGQISVGGMTIEAATQKIRSVIAKIYSTVASGQSKVNVTLSKIRTIKVTIIGSKQSGNYSVSSLSTVYNALYIAGGPGSNGSYRSIELIRDNKVIQVIDVYKFLLYGNQSDNVGLKDEDVIRIPVYKNRVTIEGKVKRPGIFELKNGENFLNLVEYASGFNDDAFTASINVVQKTSTEFKVLDVEDTEFKNYEPQNGDVIQVSKILDRFANRIQIDGTVFRPDSYSLMDGMRVSDLIEKAEGLKEDAYKERAKIVRTKEDRTLEIMNIDLNQALAGNLDADILLKKEDVLTIYSILDFKESFKVSIFGEIKTPGDYQFLENLTLNDLLIQAGGLTGAASKRIEISRMIKDENFDAANPNRIETLNFEINTANNEQIKNVLLKPFDVIIIRRLAVFEVPEFVNISGAIVYPGKYALANKTERVYDVIARAGGLSPYADSTGLRIKRPLEKVRLNLIKEANAQLNENTDDESIEKIVNEGTYSTIPVDWKAIVKNTNSLENIRLLPGDEIQVPVFYEGVRVTGSVVQNTEIPFKEGKSFNYYLDKSGGASFKAWKKKSYVIYPNGLASTTKSFLFFKSYPEIRPGSQIVVVEKPVKENKITTTDVIGVASVLGSLAAIVFAILR